MRHLMAEAISVAESNTRGSAISGGLIQNDDKLTFVVVVLGGGELKQVILEPPQRRQKVTWPLLRASTRPLVASLD